MGFSRLGYSIGLNWFDNTQIITMILCMFIHTSFEVQVLTGLGFSHAFYVDAPNNSRSVFT